MKNERHAKITGIQDFNDLVIDRILFESTNSITTILTNMFPDSNDIDVREYTNGNVEIQIDEVKVKLYTTNE